MVERRTEVVQRLKSLEELAAPLISFLQNPQLVQELRQDKQYNLQMLQERYKVGCFEYSVPLLLPKLPTFLSRDMAAYGISAVLS
jgi:hypothetical protein